MKITDFRNLLTEAKKQNHPYYPIWALMGLTGIRNAEAKALRWSDVDLDKKAMLIRNTMSKVDRDESPSITPLKNIRSVPLEEEAQELLEELKKTTTTDFVFPRLKSWLNDTGSQYLKRFLHEIGMEQYNLNSLRQLHATRFLQDLSQVEIEKILASLGHKTYCPDKK